jgi:non-lysosomal glucosylceramidase
MSMAAFERNKGTAISNMMKHFLFLLTVLLAGSAALAATAGEISPLTNRCDNALARLRFLNRGVVRSDMRFEFQTQPCFYVETPAQWSCPWGSTTGGASYPYLGLVGPSSNAVARPQSDVVFEDFERKSYAPWRVEGKAFGAGPLEVSRVRFNAAITGQSGRRIAISFPEEGQDGLQGKLTSAPFTIQRAFIRFLIAGGAHPRATCMNLLVDSQIVRTATGQNSHALTSVTWDVRQFAGQSAVLEIVDAETGGWGHVLVDHIVFTDAGPVDLLVPPLGLRSAVPLGGLGAGTVELRADGSLRDWNIFNNSPGGGGGKVQLNDALFGLWTRQAGAEARAWTLRTQPPADLPPISQIEYSGAYPVSRLRFADAALPLAVDLYAYSEWVPRDATGSATPAVLFTFNLFNPSAEAVEAALLFNLPNHPGGKIFDAEGGLRLERAGHDPLSGTMALRFSDPSSVSHATAGSVAEVWRDFSRHGELGRTNPGGAEAKQAAVAAKLTLKGGEAKTLTLVLAWDFPGRPYAHGTERVGNYYSRLFTSAEDVAEKVLARLPRTWQEIEEWQETCLDNDLPPWLQDALLNGVSTMAKTGLWSEDGRWRQWESFSCPNVEPVHIHWYRALPYAFFFPDLEKNQFRGFAHAQEPDGFIHEDLGAAGKKLDQAGGRVMSDCTSTFILGVFELYHWTGDRAFLAELWPHARKAAQWQMERSEPFGLPRHLNNTYDWWAFDRKDVVSYNAVLHLAALRAAEQLAEAQGDSTFARLCGDRRAQAERKLDELLWTGQYFRSWWMHEGAYPDALHADTLYGQLWASILGLGWVVDPPKARAHLAAEQKYNSSPFGLRVMSNRDGGLIDDLVWLAGSPDWSALNLYLGGDVDSSLAEAEKLVNVWREHLHDFWDWRDLVRSDNGQPWCNSHYARHLMLWAIPLALSGQEYSATGRKLAFAPRPGAPARLPWFVPGANGVLERREDGHWNLTVLSGKLDVSEVQVGALRTRLREPLRRGRALGIP